MKEFLGIDLISQIISSSFLGIVSFGHIPCGTDEGVFTRVSHYQEWIKERL